ncbi:MAG: CRTAC1 family protein [Roseibacillus sp.]
MKISPSTTWTLVLTTMCAATFFTIFAKEEKSEKTSTPFFSEKAGVIPFEERSRRKWDSPLIVDLDQDGHLDIVTTDHAFRACVHWNEGGTFSEPQKIVGGDTHGVVAADYDLDGKIELIFYPGGGDGANPKNPIMFEVNKDRTFGPKVVFEDFERARGRATKMIDADQDGLLDLVLTGFPLPAQQKEGANLLFANKGAGNFEYHSRLPFAQWMGFRSQVTDYNKDGDPDVLFFGGKNIVIAEGGEGMSFQNVTGKVLGELSKTTFATSVVEIDFDNDGDEDLFVTRADHPFAEKTFVDEEASRFAFFARRQRFLYDNLKVEGDFQFENLQMAYPDFDVFVGRDKRLLEFEVERHGHKDFTLTPAEAEGWPENIDANGLYIGFLGEETWRVGGESKSPTAGVIHNMKELPAASILKAMPSRLFENREGRFHDVTEAAGIGVAEQTTGSAVGDFDNNGWLDLFVVCYGNSASASEQILLLNEGGKFTRIENHGIISQELGSVGSGAEALDYDEDGDLDLIFCNERGRWHLFTNNSLGAEQGNYLTIKVGSSPTGKATAQGAVLSLKAGEHTMRRTVGSSYGGFSHSLNNHLHIGLGQLEGVESASVRWSNGEVLPLTISDLNKAYTAGKF